MREYKDRKNAQAKSYHSDRFFKAPPTPKESVDSDEVFKDDLKKIKKVTRVKEAYVEIGQLVIYINPKDIREVAKVLKNELEYDFLSEMSAIDFMAVRDGFEIFYQFLSMNKRKRLRIKYFITSKEAVETICDIFKSADWAEREMYDMFGIYINNHPYLKRLLMPDDWHGHPLLKSYPLIGDEEAQWYEIDTIFGKEYRDVIGPENRDTKFVDPKDTKNFARIKHEVGYGEKPSAKPTDFNKLQEDDGVPFISDLNQKSKQLKDRK